MEGGGKIDGEEAMLCHCVVDMTIGRRYKRGGPAVAAMMLASQECIPSLF
jgi:hypothetical protein